MRAASSSPRPAPIAGVTLAMLISAVHVGAPPPDTITDEARVAPYTLPDPLRSASGDRIVSPEQWRAARRPELLELFRREVYGRVPENARRARMETRETDRDAAALGGTATRIQLALAFPEIKGAPVLHLLVYRPNAAGRPAPAFLGMNFWGNHTVHPDPRIALSGAWVPAKALGTDNHRATEASRGTRVDRWPIERIVQRGYALATMHYCEVEPDHAEGWKEGARGAFGGHERPDGWGAIAAWAWGLSRALDALATLPGIDASRVAVLGHSRLGKTALWAGAEDERFAIVISNDSGCGGAALSKRVFGETVAHINKSFPHWFCPNFKRYSDRETDLPVDQHELIALAAPRPVYVASASEDLWADPKGEFLGAQGAEPVYALLGLPGLGTGTMPPAGRSIGGRIGYHLREGKHDLTAEDWEHYMNFADRHFGR